MGRPCFSECSNAAAAEKFRARLFHRFDVHFEVAEHPAVGQLIRFLAEDELIDEPPRLRIANRQPGHGRTGQLLLKGLQKAHEIPNREDVMLHEYADAVQVRKFDVQWVLFHGVPVRNNGTQKYAELIRGFAHRMIPIARLSHGPHRA